MVLLCSLFSFLLVIYACLAYVMRKSWDGIFLNCILKPLGRVPATENFLAVCLSGPGISYDYFEKLTPAEALVLLQAKLEEEELNKFHEYHNKRIQEPLINAKNLYESLLKDFSSGSYLIPRIIPNSTNQIIANLQDQVKERRKIFESFKANRRQQIRMHGADLNECLELASVLLSDFYERRIFSRYLSKEEFFRQQGAAFNDWAGVTSGILQSLFSPEFLVPLEETDKVFSLEVDHVGVRQFLQGIKDNTPREDLDRIRAKIPMFRMKKLTVPFNPQSWLADQYFAAIPEIIFLGFRGDEKFTRQIKNWKKGTDPIMQVKRSQEKIGATEKKGNRGNYLEDFDLAIQDLDVPQVQDKAETGSLHSVEGKKIGQEKVEQAEFMVHFEDEDEKEVLDIDQEKGKGKEKEKETEKKKEKPKSISEVHLKGQASSDDEKEEDDQHNH